MKLLIGVHAEYEIQECGRRRLLEEVCRRESRIKLLIDRHVEYDIHVGDRMKVLKYDGVLM